MILLTSYWAAKARRAPAFAEGTGPERFSAEPPADGGVALGCVALAEIGDNQEAAPERIP